MLILTCQKTCCKQQGQTFSHFATDVSRQPHGQSRMCRTSQHIQDTKRLKNLFLLEYLMCDDGRFTKQQHRYEIFSALRDSPRQQQWAAVFFPSTLVYYCKPYLLFYSPTCGVFQKKKKTGVSKVQNRGFVSTRFKNCLLFQQKVECAYLFIRFSR